MTAHTKSYRYIDEDIASGSVMDHQHASNQFTSMRRKPSAPFGSLPGAAGVTIVLLSLWFAINSTNSCFGRTDAYHSSLVAAVTPQWKDCEGFGKEYQCSSLAVPLDYRNESDGRTINIALTRLLASDQDNRFVISFCT